MRRVEQDRVAGAALCALLELKPSQRATVDRLRREVRLDTKAMIRALEAARREGMVTVDGGIVTLTAAATAALAEGRAELDADYPGGLA